MTEKRDVTALPLDRDPESFPVGEGPLYEAIRAEAKKLAETWHPHGMEGYQPYWGAGICGVTREDNKNVVSVETFGREKRGLGVRWEVSMQMLRASAISLLIYCEAYGDE